jgi:hypothetical protein
MSRVRSSGSIFWALILIVAGGLLLARNLGYGIPVWTGVARYWPAVLIAWGLFKFVDYFRFRESGATRQLFSAGEVVLLIMIIMAGSALTIASNINPDLRDIFNVGNIDIWDITGNSYEYSEHYEMEARTGSSITVVNRYGGVEVTPSETDRISVDVKKMVLASNQEEADRLAQRLMFSIKDELPGYRIVADYSGERGFQGRRIRTSLTVRVPKRASMKIDNRNGTVSVVGLVGDQDIANAYADVVAKDIEGNVALQNRNGSVEVSNIKGPATITNAYANVEARGITGALELHNRNGNVEVTAIGGSAKLSNAYANTTAKNIGGDLDIDTRNGTVEVESIKGSATISNAYSPINVSNVQGELRIRGRNNSVEVEHAGSDVTVQTSYNNVTIRDAKGAVSVDNRNGDVLVAFAQPPTKDVSVSTQYSGVSIEMPANSSFSLDGRTRFGQIRSDFEGLSETFAERNPDRERGITGRVGQGGPTIKVETRNGDIRIEKRG